MRLVRDAALAVAAACLVAIAVVPIRAEVAAGVETADRQAKGSVYLLRGGADIFSTGMDELAGKLRARGIDAKAQNHRDYLLFAAEAKARYAANHQPIVIVGHSFGANAAIMMATELLKTKTPVALLVIFEATAMFRVPPNVAHVVNFYSSVGTGLDIKLEGTSRFNGVLDNINITAFDHYNIDNAAVLHDRVIAEIEKLTGAAVQAKAR